MSPLHELMTGASSQVELLDHRTVEWNRVRRTRYWMDQRFSYRYPGRIRELRQRLMVIPRDHYGPQRVCAYDLRVSTPSASTTTTLDAFGNPVFTAYIPEVEGEVTFEMRLVVERHLEAAAWPHVSAAEATRYRTPTPLTSADAPIADVARELQARHADPEERAEAVNEWVYRAMQYGHGATTVATTAAEALRIGRGLCQDYAHVMLAVGRAAGLAARYVSGHMLGEGGSHAWVEVLLPDGPGAYRAVAFDPTHDRRTTPSYIVVAIGRDYRDVSPTSGSFIAPYAGQLTTSKRAGLTHLEYRSSTAQAPASDPSPGS